MTIHGTGSLITMAEISAEFGRGNDLAAYRGVQWWGDDGSTGTFSSGLVSMYEFYNKRATSPFPDTPGGGTLLMSSQAVDSGYLIDAIPGGTSIIEIFVNYPGYGHIYQQIPAGAYIGFQTQVTAAGGIVAQFSMTNGATGGYAEIGPADPGTNTLGGSDFTTVPTGTSGFDVSANIVALVRCYS